MCTSTGVCIDSRRRCDGYHDCNYGEDEEHCFDESEMETKEENKTEEPVDNSAHTDGTVGKNNEPEPLKSNY